MEWGMRRGAVISGGLHVLIILAALIALPPTKLDTSADDSVSFDVVGPSQPQHAKAPGKVTASADTPKVNHAPTADKTPNPNKPIVPPPPITPPPPETTPAPPTLPKPPDVAPQPPPTVVSPDAVPTPPVPPKPPQKNTSTLPQPAIPLPPGVQPPAPNQSHTHQKNVVKTPADMSTTVENTINRLRDMQKQDKPPTSTYNPDSGGAPNGGGNPDSTANSGLSGADRNAIGAHVRPCWGIDAGAPGVAGFAVVLDVTTDAAGVVRQAAVDPRSQGNMGDPFYAAYASRAIDAVMNAECATLPLPPAMLGQVNTFIFNFSP